MYRDDTFSSTQEVFNDNDDNVRVNDLIRYTQESVGGGGPFDSGDAQDPAPVQGFFSGGQVNQDGYTSDGDYRGDDDFSGDGENRSVGADVDHHINGGMSGPGR